MAAALAALPLADAGVKYAAEVSKSIVAQITSALQAPILAIDQTTTKRTRRGEVVRTSKAAIPAWLVVGGALSLWLLGLGVGYRNTGAGDGKNHLTWTERERFSPTFRLWG